MYSIGTPYLGSTSATIDVGIGGFFGYISEGERDIINKDIYLDYYNRWNNNYGLYEKINVHALGGYSSLKFVLDTFYNYSKEIASAISIFATLETKVRFSPYFPLNKDILIESLLNKIRNDFSDANALVAFEDIFSNEIEFSLKNPFIYLKNDFFVDLDSQLGEKTINGIKRTYKGIK